MKVATSAPAMPRRRGQQEAGRLVGARRQLAGATMPATKPTNTIHRIPMIRLALDAVAGAPQTTRFISSGVGRRPRGEMIDRLGQLFAEARQQFLARQSRARHQEVDLLSAS